MSAQMTQPQQNAPAMLDLEQEFTNHLAIKDSLEYILREGVPPELLLAPRTKSVYSFVQHHFTTTNKMPSAKVFATEFPNLVFEAPDATVQYVVDKLRERYQRNEIEQMLTDVAEVAEKKPAEAMKRLRNATFEIEKNSLSQRNLFQPGDYHIFIRELKDRIQAGFHQGVSIGFPDVDTFTGGVKRGDLAYILARQKRQKTFMTLNAFIHQTLADQAPVFFTLENPAAEIKLRLSCMLSGVPWDLAQKGQLMPQHYRSFDQAWADFDKHKYFVEQPGMDERTIPILLNKAEKLGAESILISQFKYLKGTKDWYRNETDQHAEIAIDLKGAATRAGQERPFIVEAQFNRGGDTMEELEDFDGSKVGLTDMIGQACDTLYGLFQNKDMRQNNTLEFGILEARNHDRAAWYIESEYQSRTEIRLQAGSQH
jgi:replicative DNA helicase